MLGAEATVVSKTEAVACSLVHLNERTVVVWTTTTALGALSEIKED